MGLGVLREITHIVCATIQVGAVAFLQCALHHLRRCRPSCLTQTSMGMTSLVVVASLLSPSISRRRSARPGARVIQNVQHGHG